MKEKAISKALEEVWEWKEKVAKDIEGKNFEEKKRYFQEGIDEAAKLLKANLIKNSDGSYLLQKARNL